MSKSQLSSNAISLYVRMLVVIFINFFSIRLLVRYLGLDRFGVFNVIAGVVASFSFVSVTLTTAAQRYFSTEIGKRNFEGLNKTFKSFLFVFGLLVVSVFFVTEFIAKPFLVSMVKVPAGFNESVDLIFSLAVVQLCLSLLIIPFQALLLSFENMRAYAVLSILESVMKLVSVLLLGYFGQNKIAPYMLNLIFGGMLLLLIHAIYIKQVYPMVDFRIGYDKAILKDLFSFLSWTSIGGLATVAKMHGLNLLLNNFFGPTVNASRAISTQLSGSISQLGSNVFNAYRPRIVKTYANQDYKEMNSVICNSLRLSTGLLLIFTLPISILMGFLLNVWIGNINSYMVTFARLAVINVIVDALSLPIISLAQATGNVRNYQLVVGGVFLLNLPISFLLVRSGAFPEVVFLVSIGLSALCFLLRMLLAKKLVPALEVDEVYVTIYRYLMLLIVNYVLFNGISMMVSSVKWSFFIAMLGGFVALVLFFYKTLKEYERNRMFLVFRKILNLGGVQ